MNDSTLNEVLIRDLALNSVCNTAAVEAAVLRGQFNVAKVLRAVAHLERSLAIDLARKEAAAPPDQLLTNAADRLRQVTGSGIGQEAAATLIDILERSRRSLSHNPDILETDVAQSLWGCRICGWVAEGDQPEVCRLCGALAPEFEWFGPFFGGTARIGTFLPQEAVTTIRDVGPLVAGSVAGVDEARANAEPSPGEWSLKITLAHMLETDRLFAQRVRFMIDPAQTGPVPRPRPPWKLHEGSGYEDMPLAKVLADYLAVRAKTLELVDGLTQAHWASQKAGTTLAELATWMAQHEIGHMQQLRRLAGKPPCHFTPQVRS